MSYDLDTLIDVEERVKAQKITIHKVGHEAIDDYVYSDNDPFQYPRARLSFFEIAFVLYCHVLALALLGSAC